MSIYEREIKRIAEGDLPWEKLEGKSILISGATGMIGKCLVDVLMARNVNATREKKIRVAALSRNEERAKERFASYMGTEDFVYRSCDVNREIPECGQVDYVIHAASNTHPVQYAGDPIGTIASNVTGTKNLLDYAVSHGTKHFCLRWRYMAKTAGMWKNFPRDISAIWTATR